MLFEKDSSKAAIYNQSPSENTEINTNKTYLVYEENLEMQNEINDLNNRILKNNNIWLSAKQIISYSLKNNTNNTEFFWDYLDILFKDTKDTFNDIKKVIYSTNDFCIEFDNSTISKYVVDNLKITKFKPSGYIFNSSDNNKWDFKIVVITNKNIYAANRYINENTIGFY